MREYELIKLYEYNYYPDQGEMGAVSKAVLFARMYEDGEIEWPMDDPEDEGEYIDRFQEGILECVVDTESDDGDCWFRMRSTNPDAEGEFLKRCIWSLFVKYRRLKRKTEKKK